MPPRWMSQSWSIHALDPVPGPLGGGVRFLRATVRGEEEAFSHNRRQQEPCLVIDYSGDGLTAGTWVSQKTGLVLFQEVSAGQDRWALYRD